MHEVARVTRFSGLCIEGFKGSELVINEMRLHRLVV